MTIDEAIKELKERVNEPLIPTGFRQAIQLGIEALERIKLDRAYGMVILPLPSEKEME